MLHEKVDRFAQMRVAPQPDSQIRRIVAVMSGKGGVGKSSVTALLASALHAEGLAVGILDADITGPSIPHLFGVEGKATIVRDGIMPKLTPGGIKLMSMNCFLDDETQPAVWRGPMINGMLKEFWSKVHWGPLDVLLLDLPPGTGDVPISLFQMIKVSGLLVLTSPQSLVSMVVEKAVRMGRMMDVPVLGLVENFAWLSCPHCTEKISLYGPSHSAELAEVEGLPLLASLPLEPALAAKLDAGQAEAITDVLPRALLDAVRGTIQ